MKSKIGTYRYGKITRKAIIVKEFPNMVIASVEAADGHLVTRRFRRNNQGLPLQEMTRGNGVGGTLTY